MTISDFIENYANRLFEKLSFENKKIILMGDFNINLMNSNTDKDPDDFLELITTNSFIPLIIRPTRITTTTKTLIDNIFTNITEVQSITGNITCSISDHLAQFAIINLKTDNIKQQYKKQKRDFKNFNKDDFILDILSIDWDEKLKLSQKNSNISMTSLITSINTTLDKHAPIKTVSSRKINPKKPWVTKGIIISINKRLTL